MSMKTGCSIERCNQFILGPDFVSFPNWQHITAGGPWRITAHPSLNVCQENGDGKSITLLGFILDPDSPRESDAKILAGLLAKFITFSSLVDESRRFGGRWVIVAHDERSTNLIHDACGLRQVFYARNAPAWCASQPELIAEALGFEVDREADEFFRLQMACIDQQCWWPGDSSPYTEIAHLLPNHYLDLDQATAYRYWPNRQRDSISVDDGIRAVSSALCGTVFAAANRFNLCLSLTAGYDSRTILAACKGIAHHLSYSTVQTLGGAAEPDVKVARALVERLGFQHNEIKSATCIDKEFFEAYIKSVKYPHLYWYPMAQAFFEFYKKERVEITGSVSEIGRNFYGVREIDLTKAGETLASLAAMAWHPFAVRHFQKWFNGLGDTRGYSLLDIFYWENRVGNWLAMCQAENDVTTKDILSPFNCRNLIVSMLGVHEDERSYPNYSFHRKLMSNLWPAVLDEPINPHMPTPSRLRQRLSQGKRMVKSGVAKLHKKLSGRGLT